MSPVWVLLQLVEVHTGGSVFFLFFKLTKEQYLQQLQLLEQQQQEALKQSQKQTAATSNSNSAYGCTASAATTSSAAVANCAPTDYVAAAFPKLAAAGSAASNSQTSHDNVPVATPVIANRLSRSSRSVSPGPYVREGVAVLKVGFNRLAMQAEQFANELTRHLGIAAPDCRIVRQVSFLAASRNYVHSLFE